MLSFFERKIDFIICVLKEYMFEFDILKKYERAEKPTPVTKPKIVFSIKKSARKKGNYLMTLEVAIYLPRNEKDITTVSLFEDVCGILSDTEDGDFVIDSFLGETVSDKLTDCFLAKGEISFDFSTDETKEPDRPSDGVMSFKNFIFPSLPEKTKVYCSSRVVETSMPYLKSVSEKIENHPRVVSGSGKFIGKNARFFAIKLASMQRDFECGALSLPSLSPFDACFSKFCYTENSKNGEIEYEFEFCECDTKKEFPNVTIYGFRPASESKDLYDLARVTGNSLETLIILNPELTDPSKINEEVKYAYE